VPPWVSSIAVPCQVPWSTVPTFNVPVPAFRVILSSPSPKVVVPVELRVVKAPLAGVA